MESTAQIIKKHRESMNYSQEYIARQLGISQPAYAKLENGNTRITLKRLFKLAEILQRDPKEFLTGNNPINLNGDDNSYDLVEKLYKDNKEIQQKLIDLLHRENQRLLLENERLWKIIQSEKRI